MDDITLLSLRRFFETGATRPEDFRRLQLSKLKSAILKYNQEINDALFTDLHKSPEEIWVTETGLLLAEINKALKNLSSWIKPQKASTNLMNLPSTSKIHRDPLGVVLIVAPWNYPFQLLLVPLVGAIAGGNCVLLKPSELAPATAAITERIIDESFDPEYIKVVLGDGKELVPLMMHSFRFDHVFFTGGLGVGKIIYQLAAAKLIPVTLELGGKSPAIVERDANLTIAAKRIALGKFSNAGQICVAPDYILVHEDVKDHFIKILKQVIVSFYGENPKESHNYGRIINLKRFDQLCSYLTDGTISFGGDHDRSQLFIAPTIMEDVPLNCPLMEEEIFGPILPVFGFRTMEEAKKIIRLNPDPLALYLFTSSLESEKLWMESVSFGGGCVNNADLHFTNYHLPFGGVGTSGIGSYHGKFSFEVFTHAKAIMKTPNWVDPAVKYPPFKGKLPWLKRLVR